MLIEVPADIVAQLEYCPFDLCFTGGLRQPEYVDVSPAPLAYLDVVMPCVLTVTVELNGLVSVHIQNYRRPSSPTVDFPINLEKRMFVDRDFPDVIPDVRVFGGFIARFEEVDVPTPFRALNASLARLGLKSAGPL